MNPIALPKSFPYKPRVLFTDVDDTLTWEGALPPEAFTALINLQKAGIKVIPVTGASAGWCDCMLRTWPIESIIGENGAYFADCDEQRRLRYHFALDAQQRAINWQRLMTLKDQVLAQFPHVHLAADQAFRLSDIAFDFNQDQRLSRADAFEIATLCEAAGMTVKISSIHINVWLGAYNKATTTNDWLAKHAIDGEDALFIGDSLNDESMFENFSYTVGVANIKPWLPEFKSPPKFITEQPGGYGFAEMAASLLAGLGSNRHHR